MSQPVEQGPNPANLTQPASIVTDEILDCVYNLPGTSTPDLASQDEFTDYAKSRFDPRHEGTEPTIVTATVPATAKRWRKGEGWIGDITPRLSLAVFLGTTIVANLSGNLTSLTADAKELGNQLLHNGRQTVSDWLGKERPAETKEVTTTKPGEVTILHQNFPQPVGESVPSEAGITKLVDKIEYVTEKGGKVTKVTIFAGSSDERGPDESTLQVPNPGNDELDSRRANDAAEELKEQSAAAGLDLPEIEVVSAEDILEADEVAELKAEAARHKLSLEDAIRIYNDGGELPADLYNLLQSKLGDARSVAIEVELQEPDQSTTETVTVEPVSPENKDHDYKLYLGIPLPFARRRYREEYATTKTEEWLRPGTAADERWVELYREALQADGSIPSDSWQYTRKYQLLAREDRIDYSLTQRYTDAAGEDHEMRVMFVDHDPTPETVAMYQQLLTNVSQMRDGEVAKRWSAITVYPREQVGTEPNAGRKESDRYPHHPKDIGLDIDKQDPRNVLGIAMPALGLVEVHMPENPTKEDLEEYMGALWVAGHEFAGHATDTNGEPTYLRPTGPAHFRHYISTSTWADVAEPAFQALPDSDAEGQREFSVTRKVGIPGDTLITLKDEVSSGGSPEIGPVRGFFLRMLGVDLEAQAQVGIDSRLRESQEAVLNGRKPTKYSSESAGELYGETAAQVVSGAPIPYGETGLRVTPRHPELAKGYSVDPGLKKMFEERTGWSRETARPVDENQFTFSLATDDPVLREFINTARNTPMPNDRITILSRVASVEEKATS